MTSSAYIATDGETVMKVGKTNDVKRREKQIAVPITHTIACLDEAASRRLENQLRDFVLERGGIRHQGTVDWFQFDSQIYTMLCQVVVGLDGQAITENDLDREIGALVSRYYKLLRDELVEKNKRLREELKQMQEAVYQLNQEVELWRTVYRTLRGIPVDAK
jgi:hypothetical protein